MKTMVCQQCGGLCNYTVNDTCQECYNENVDCEKRIDEYQVEGHTNHCANRLVWGDGECECHMKEKTTQN